jgi:outer membrane immunogenic protein
MHTPTYVTTLHSMMLTALLATTVAVTAADLPVKAPPKPPPAPIPMPAPFSWSGFYIGGNIGGEWSQRHVTDTLLGVTFDTGQNNASFIGGGQAGANYQISNIVLGVEGTFDWTASNNNTMAGVVIPNVGTVRVNDRDHGIATVAARFGLAFDRLLAYGKAGGGWVGTNNFTVTNVTTGTTITGTNNNTSSGGWLVGAGLEWAFTDSLSAKVEYDFLGLGNRAFTVPASAVFLPGDTFNMTKHDVQMATVGLNYRFNWGGGVSTRY